MHGARTPVSFPTTPAWVHGGAHFCTKKAAHMVILARVLVVHLVEGGSSTTGEQTNCDLTRYVKLKKEANHVGPTLEARLYTLEYF